MVKKILMPILLLLVAILIVWYGQKATTRFQTSEPISTIQKTENTQVKNTLPSTPIESRYQNQTYGFGFEIHDGFSSKESTFKEPQPGGTVFLVQLGDSEVTSAEAYIDKGIMVYVAKIDSTLANGSDPLAAPNGMDTSSQKDTIVGGEKARIYNNGEVYTVAKNGYEYLLVLGTDADQVTKDAFSKVVSSFVFTN